MFNLFKSKKKIQELETRIKVLESTIVSLKSDSSSYKGNIVLQIDGAVIGKVALNKIQEMQKQGEVKIIPA